jgi:hypothetical protein
VKNRSPQSPCQQRASYIFIILFVATISFAGAQIIEKSASPDNKFSVEIVNQLIRGDLSGPIILLNQDYFIYSSRDSVFFHSRVKERRIFCMQ